MNDDPIKDFKNKWNAFVGFLRAMGYYDYVKDILEVVKRMSRPAPPYIGLPGAPLVLFSRPFRCDNCDFQCYDRAVIVYPLRHLCLTCIAGR